MNLKGIVILWSAGCLSACTVIADNGIAHAAGTDTTGNIAVFNPGYAQCADILSQPVSLPVNPQGSIIALDSQAIDLLNWNIKKGTEKSWSEDLDSYSTEMELVLIQEAMHTMDVHFGQDKPGSKSFAAGYEKGQMKSGVATYSSIAPIHQCQLSTLEPWLHTPKATSITRYALSDSSETLLVVNIHMINFTLGLRHFRSQLASIVDLLSGHQGPMIISGDFNTWRPLRETILNQQMDRLGMQQVTFDEDHRSRFFGRTVDHIFIHKLSVREATTHETRSSDHNPMTISLSLSI